MCKEKYLTCQIFYVNKIIKRIFKNYHKLVYDSASAAQSDPEYSMQLVNLSLRKVILGQTVVTHLYNYCLPEDCYSLIYLQVKRMLIYANGTFMTSLPHSASVHQCIK